MATEQSSSLVFLRLAVQGFGKLVLSGWLV